MNRTRRQLLLLSLAVFPVFQTGCTLLDGGFIERTLTGAVLNPIAAAVFQQFFSFGAGTGF